MEYEITCSGNKHLSKRKKSFLRYKRDVINLRDDDITQFMIKKFRKIRLTTQTKCSFSTSST